MVGDKGDVRENKAAAGLCKGDLSANNSYVIEVNK
jgi:hypothetical protein